MSDVATVESEKQINEGNGEENLRVTVKSRGKLILHIGVEAPDDLSEVRSEQPSEESGFKKLGDAWLESVLGFFEAFPLFGTVAHFVHVNQASIELVPLLEQISQTMTAEDLEEKDTIQRTYELGRQHFHKITRKVDSLNRFKRAEKSFGRAQLLAVVSEYEAFICDLLRIIISRNPDAFISKDATVSASDVIRASSVESIRTFLIEDKIDAIQRESHVDQIRLIYDRLKLTHPDEKSMREFAQICECRNILTHANGKVNRQYISKLKKLGFMDEDLPKIGDEVIIDERYIRRSAARVFLMGYFTLHILWQHLDKNSARESIPQLINCAHEFLLEGYTKMAARISEFVLNPKSPATEIDRAYSLINLALSVRLDKEVNAEEKTKRIEKILSRRDWSIVSPLFKLALACVRNDQSQLTLLIDGAVSDGLKAESFLTWALFTNVRETPAFRERMLHHFGIVLDDVQDLPEKPDRQESEKFDGEIQA